MVPSFDGWIKNPDGTFTLVFGYMNRNYEQELAIGPGPDNKLEPGAVDQGSAPISCLGGTPGCFE